MIFVVSGYRRSGTSMMMKALYAGLRDGQILYQPGQEGIGAKEEGGYIPNPSGLHEVGQAYYMNAEFLRRMPDKSLVKILFDGLPNLPQGNYTVFYMLRDPEEIGASCKKVDQHLRQVGVQENGMARYPWDSFRPYDQNEIDHVLGICEARSDILLVKTDFRRVIDDPLGAFNHLAKYIQIDPEKAAAVVNPNFYRFKSEELDGSASESRNAGAPPVSQGSGIQDFGSRRKEDRWQYRAV